MNLRFILFIIFLAFSIKVKAQSQTDFINPVKKATAHYGNDKDWYVKNIPFFETSDQSIENVYYYRWELYKAHLRNIGKYGYVVTEFLNGMDWDQKPYNTLNAATVFHIAEGRWLKNPIYMDNYIDFMYQHGGNNRRYTEAIADAAFGRFLVRPDTAFIVKQLPSMIKIYDAWKDHYDKSKGLYWVEPIMDATENTISSIDASGGTDGFTGGFSFRPSINSYMYANALAIKKIALLNGDQNTAAYFAKRALEEKQNFQSKLWNSTLGHFTDRFQMINEHVKYWDFIRGRELVGFVPWAFNLPDDDSKYTSAWKRITDTTAFAGKFGLRTVEPSYQYYMKQFRFAANGQRECQWNGPSWPYQTSQILLGMANLLNNYHQSTITDKEYVDILRQYTAQHYDKGTLNLLENYDPDKGGAIADFDQRSEHYNHSEFNDIIITGFCGLRPSAGNKLTINPLITKTGESRIRYFCLENVLYKGNFISVLYDEDGEKYHQGKGISVYVNGKQVLKASPLGSKTIDLPIAKIQKTESQAINLAVNLGDKPYPKLTVTNLADTSGLKMINDGRVWFFKDVKNSWKNISTSKNNWITLDFGQQKSFQKIALYISGEKSPKKCKIQYLGQDGNWINAVKTNNEKLLVNTTNSIDFNEVNSQKVRFSLDKVVLYIEEIEVY